MLREQKSLRKCWALKMNSNKKIGIVGYFGRGNAGDEAMKDLLLENFPGSVASNERDEIEKCDAYIVAGGDLVQGFSGLHMPELWQKITTEKCYAISLGVREGWETKKELAIKSLSVFKYIFTRDKNSFDILSKYVKVEGLMPDLVLLADAPASQETFPILFNYTDRDWLTPNGQYESVCEQGNILPIAISAQKFDTKYAEKVMSYKEFISAAKSSRGVIGARLHAIAMGVISGVPVAGISYESKVAKFCERYDIPCFEYGQSNGLEITKSMRKAKIDLSFERKQILSVLEKIKLDIYS